MSHMDNPNTVANLENWTFTNLLDPYNDLKYINRNEQLLLILVLVLWGQGELSLAQGINSGLWLAEAQKKRKSPSKSHRKNSFITEFWSQSPERALILVLITLSAAWASGVSISGRSSSAIPSGRNSSGPICLKLIRKTIREFMIWNPLSRVALSLLESSNQW